MESSSTDRSKRPFTVVLKGTSAVRIPFGKGAKLLLQDGDEEIEVRILTRWVDSGFDHPLPREMYFDMRLRAPSIDAAIEEARLVSHAVTPIVSFASNAEVGSIDPHVAFETTPGVTEREFVEYFLPDESGLVSASRHGDVDAIAALTGAVIGSKYPKGIGNALAHYHEALGHYRLGGESLAVGHLFMAAEALKEIALAEYCNSEQLSEDEIAAGINGYKRRGDLLAWARRILVFHGDAKTHRKAKEASDALEHGFSTIGHVQGLAESVCDDTFKHVRATIVGLLDVPEETRLVLLGRFGSPADSRSMRRRIVGTLVGDGDDLAAEGADYPLVEWSSEIAQFDASSDGELTAQFTDSFTVRTADGIGLRLKRSEIHGRPRPSLEAEQVDGLGEPTSGP